MKTVFLNIAYMTYYKGITDTDVQINGDSDAFDQFNFCMANIDEEEVLIGYADNGGTAGGLPLEKLDSDTVDYAENVLAVWCAKNADGELVTVGWYKNATIYRNYCTCTFESDDAVCGYEQYFNVEALFKDCVLLPENERTKREWVIDESVVSSFDKYKNVWFADKTAGEKFSKKAINYSGKNLL